MGLPVSGAEMRGLSWGDYDGDGWFDLYAGATKATEANLLFRNESGRRFVRQDLTPVAPGRSARQSSWVDFDNDGDLDLFASNRTRSEENTSELQSLMRISYAVFCLKKKKTKNNTSK